uniref:Choline/carnitine acyltransferase domain-containing protein n=1 Tax=Bicosoecida sp. CB-2014 TaxID=1486930 RepID=A0A7S1CRN0_9STRA
MAEAHAFANIGSHQKRGVLLHVTEEGVTFNVSVHIPSLPLLRRAVWRRIFRFRNAAVNGFYPLGPLFVLVFVAVLIVTVLSVGGDNWLRSGSVADVVWEIGLRLPWADGCGNKCRIGVLAAWTGLVFLLLVVFFQRSILRALLARNPFLKRKVPRVWARVWAGLVMLLSGRKPLMYSFQSSLPALPLPALEQTVRNHMASVRHVLDEGEWEEAQREAEAFLRSEGPTLQRYLQLKRFISPNYVADWWEKYCYLRGRAPIMINSNYYCMDSAYVRPTNVQTARVAGILHQFMQFKKMIDREVVPPIMFQGVVPLCMDQYKRMFSSTRLPGRECDEIKQYDVDVSKHIAVLHHGYWYRMPMYRWDGTPFTPSEMQGMLDAVKADVAGREPCDEDEGSIAAMTAWDRSKWAEAREEYFSEGLNKVSLQMIESAILVVVLDDDAPADGDFTAKAYSLMHGHDGTDRWFDKTITMVGFANGMVGWNCEHSWADAPVIGHLIEWAQLTGEHIAEYYDARGNCKVTEPSGTAAPPTPARASWSLSELARKSIRKARAASAALCSDLDLQCQCFEAYGKGVMKACGVSPDAWIQMAMQLAYFRDQGRFRLTYESSMTRLFKLGRTETVRPVCDESVAFVRAFEDGSTTDEDVLELLRAASTRHTNVSKDCMAGQGWDRHLFGLYIVSVGKEIESPFLKRALSTPWRLSTSQQPQNQTDRWSLKNPEHEKRVSPGGGFGPVADDGYGVSYMLSGEDYVYFHVSSKRSSPETDSTRFYGHIEASFARLRDLFEGAATAAAAGGTGGGSKAAPRTPKSIGGAASGGGKTPARRSARLKRGGGER